MKIHKEDKYVVTLILREKDYMSGNTLETCLWSGQQILDMAEDKSKNSKYAAIQTVWEIDSISRELPKEGMITNRTPFIANK